MKMYALVEWFQIHYPNLHNDLIECNHNFDEQELNPYHLESDCWSHTMLVCKMAELFAYDKVVCIAALLHDIGKPQARKVNLRNNHVQFFTHEDISESLAQPILKKLLNENIINNLDCKEILILIKQHAYLHKVKDSHEIFNMFKTKKNTYIHLVELTRCDALGRFCKDNAFSDDKYKQLLFYANNMTNR